VLIRREGALATLRDVVSTQETRGQGEGPWVWAQLILERITTPPVVEVEDLEATERGAGGFGSTGVQ